ncbi:hypothetical protein [Brachybacterium hainanense]|uniref:Uncharacterized protein n=1 Tax=Brachybacterium hainanense TaxID=1541174 RepID=A0ABV6RHY5_9MICO
MDDPDERTVHLRLGIPRAGDLAPLHAIHGDPRVGTHVPGPRSTDPSVTR